MTVTTNIDRLDTSKVFPRVAIEDGAITDLLAFLNALYEALIDAACPGSGAQLYAGHDHGKEGGAPICNGSQLTLDQGFTPIYSKADFVANAKAFSSAWVGKHYISPGLKSIEATYLEAAICYTTIGSSFEVRFKGGPWVKLEITGDNTVGWRAGILIPISADMDWVDLYMDVRAVDAQGTAQTFKVFCIQVAETYAATQPKIGARRLYTATSGDTFYRFFDEELADELATAEYSFNADTLKRIFSAINGLAEVILDQRCPGVATQSIQGHDHATLLGRAIGHGKVYSAGCDLERYKASPVEEILWRVDNTATTTWEYADKGVANRRTTAASSPGGTPSTEPMFDAYISAGITSSGNPPSAAPYVEGWIYVDAEDTSADVDVRIYNQTTSTFSETITGVTINGWNYIRYIPCSGDTWNEYDVQVQHATAPAAGQDFIYINAIVISEAYEYSNNRGAAVTSTGGRFVGVPTDGVKKVAI